MFDIMNEVPVSYETLWEMPVWERDYWIKLINDRNENMTPKNESEERYESYMKKINKPPNIK